MLLLVAPIMYLLNYTNLASERAWWNFFQKRVVCTKLDIYVFFSKNQLTNADIFLKTNTSSDGRCKDCGTKIVYDTPTDST
jgi:hypothetical protein